ncbi:TPA: hypothetical protein ACSP2E_001756, partial [Aeromonas hydrophila]
TEHSWQLAVGSWQLAVGSWHSCDCTQAKREGDPGVAFVLSVYGCSCMTATFMTVTRRVCLH